MPAVIPIAAAVIGGAIASNGAKNAAKTQANAARDASADNLTAQREGIAFQQQQADQARADREPWRAMGANKLAELGQRTGQGGDLMRSFGMSDFQTDPGYQFRMAEGMKGLTNSAAARGGLLSGAALKAASRYNQDFASNEFGNASNRFVANQTNQFNRLASLADVGQVAANQNGSSAMQLGQNVGNNMLATAQQNGQNMMGAANARGSAYMAQGNALMGAINQGVSAWGQYNSGSGYYPNPNMPNASNVTPQPTGQG
jgi:hypothetical protein